jgi:Ca-activated chloride channel family protein
MEIKQIIVVTDGKSNIGGNPVTAAGEAARKGIVVNAIGIMEKRDEDHAFDEIKEIARAGRGTWENTHVANLGQTMHHMTQKTVNKTIETIVGNQLKEIIGGSLNDIPPQSRGQIVDYMERLGEDIPIKCCVVMDCSGSMANKMGTARQSMIELMNSLQGRKGKSQIAIVAFPGFNGEFCRVICDFTENIGEIKRTVYELKAGGNTPTAAAINKAIDLMMDIHDITFEEIAVNNGPLLRDGVI